MSSRRRTNELVFSKVIQILSTQSRRYARTRFLFRCGYILLFVHPLVCLSLILKGHYSEVVKVECSDVQAQVRILLVSYLRNCTDSFERKFKIFLGTAQSSGCAVFLPPTAMILFFSLVAPRRHLVPKTGPRPLDRAKVLITATSRACVYNRRRPTHKIRV